MHSSLKFAGIGLSATLAALCVGGPLHAEDLTINDLRLVVGMAPDYEADETDVDSDYRIGVDYFRTWLEPIWGGSWVWGVELSDTEADDSGVEISQLAVTGFFGWATQLAQMPEVHFEFTPFIGVGQTDLDSGSDDDTGTYFEWGLRAAALYTFANNWQAGLDLRYLSGDSEVSIGGADVDVENDGLAASLVGGYRF